MLVKIIWEDIEMQISNDYFYKKIWDVFNQNIGGNKWEIMITGKSGKNYSNYTF